MNKKIQSIVIVLFLALFSYFFGGEYTEFHKEKTENTQSYEKLQKKLSSFGVDDIKEIENISLQHTPNLELLDLLVKKIREAKHEVYLEVYILTEKKIQQALINAAKSGIQVKVLLEKNPYKSYNINNKAYNLLEKGGIDIAWSDPKDYSLNHSKLLLIDGEVIISTGNMSYSTFKYNRDLFLFIRDTEIYSTLKRIFMLDFSGTENYIYHDNLVVSPHYSRQKLETIIESAQEEILVYAQYLQDNQMNHLLIKKAKQGVKVSVIVSESYFKNGENNSEIQDLKNSGLYIRYLDKNKMHSKAFLIDQNYLFIGSINMSSYSLDKNREMGIFTKNKQVINSFNSVFQKDVK